jgi:hypothetical protein
MFNDHFLEQHANETLAEARDFLARERLARLGGALGPGERPNWRLLTAVIIGIGILMAVL